MKTLEQLAAETFPLGNETCPSKVMTIKYNQAKMVKAVRRWMDDEKYVKSFPSGGVIIGPKRLAGLSDDRQEYIIPKEVLDRILPKDVELKGIDLAKAMHKKDI